MPIKPNYKFDKRQRDLAKKKQQEEKLQRKRARSAAGKDPAESSDDTAPTPATDGDNAD